jgi:nucleoside-diphosphate-sugar epimerase
MSTDQKLYLLNNYQDIIIPKWLDKNIKQKFKNLVLIGVYGQVGIAIIRMCLKVGIHVKAITNTQIDFTHKLLTIYPHDHSLKALNNRKNIVVYTGPIHKLKNYQKIFNKTSHLICFSSTSIFTKVKSQSEDSKEIVKNLEDGENFALESSQKYGFSINILRPTMIYGYGIDNNVSMIRKYIQKYRFFPVYKNGTGLRQPVHTEDLAAAVLALLCQEHYTQDYNLAGGEVITYKKMIKKIFVSQNLLPIIPTIPLMPCLIKIVRAFTKDYFFNIDVALNMKKDFCFSCAKAEKDFNYKPRNFTLS